MEFSCLNPVRQAKCNILILTKPTRDGGAIISVNADPLGSLDFETRTERRQGKLIESSQWIE